MNYFLMGMSSVFILVAALLYCEQAAAIIIQGSMI